MDNEDKEFFRVQAIDYQWARGEPYAPWTYDERESVMWRIKMQWSSIDLNSTDKVSLGSSVYQRALDEKWLAFHYHRPWGQYGNNVHALSFNTKVGRVIYYPASGTYSFIDSNIRQNFVAKDIKDFVERVLGEENTGTDFPESWKDTFISCHSLTIAGVKHRDY